MLSELGPAGRRDRARHAALLPRDLRDARPPGRALRPEPDPAEDHLGRRAAPAARARTCGSAIPTAAATSARSSRCSARSSPTAPGPRASAATSRRAAPALQKVQWSERYGVWQLHPLADWDEKRVWAYITVNEIPYNPLHDIGLPLDRLHPLHAPDAARRGGAGGTLGGLRQAGVRHPPRRIDCGKELMNETRPR